MGDASLAKTIPFVAAAYIGIWVVAFAYLIYLGINLMNLNKQIKVLSETIKKAPK